MHMYISIERERPPKAGDSASIGSPPPGSLAVQRARHGGASAASVFEKAVRFHSPSFLDMGI